MRYLVWIALLAASECVAQMPMGGITVTSGAATYTVTGAGSNGTTTCSSPVSSGATTTCSLTANAGYIAYSASSDTCGGSLSGTTYTTGAVTSNCVVTAVYHQIFVSAGQTQATTATAATLTKTIATGDVAVCMTANAANNTSTVAITDSTAGSNTWTQTSSGYSARSTVTRVAMFWSKLASGITSVTATWSGSLSTNINLTCYDLKNMASSAIEDASVNNNAASSTTASSGSLTTTNAKDILIFGSDQYGVISSPAATAPFTLPSGGSGGRDIVSYNIVIATQSGLTTSNTWTSAQANASIFAGFKTAP